MKKTKTNQVDASSIEMAAPAVMTSEMLCYASDDELERSLSHLHTEKERAYRASYDIRPWETEICYILRELQVRSDRRAAHEKYLRTNPEDGVRR